MSPESEINKIRSIAVLKDLPVLDEVKAEGQRIMTE
jgi:hypothetical protein